ncbi:hypothetical protein DQ04_06831040 [Trypanosoma grayi]|uniref:hypothetical protein n=1 Tax=Trypanosoma grayi TaxID=71804 RepID=UPI0004F4607A|nr:hypothetical protein DQ04_06831040 [Trypanosoma grayi]KEG08602.1 hypothetical protein DQ04_06831040 [Trypanosoma grayi]
MASPHTALFLLLLCLAIASTVGARAPACSCNYGVVVTESPGCACACFGQYLLPHCLYTAGDVVNVELWLQSAGDANESLPLSGADVTAGLSGAFTLEPGDGTFVFMRSRSAPFLGEQQQRPGRKRNETLLVAATVAMPGWAAQRLLADVAQGRTADYRMQNSFSGVLYAILDVLEDAVGPAPPLRYFDESFAIFLGPTGTWALVVSNFGWLIAALIVALLLREIESRLMFNMWFNVKDTRVHPKGASATKTSGEKPRQKTKGGNSKSGSRSKRKPNYMLRNEDVAEARQKYEKKRAKLLQKSFNVAEVSGRPDDANPLVVATPARNVTEKTGNGLRERRSTSPGKGQGAVRDRSPSQYGEV